MDLSKLSVSLGDSSHSGWVLYQSGGSAESNLSISMFIGLD
jgi:hypothetical protein